MILFFRYLYPTRYVNQVSEDERSPLWVASSFGYKSKNTETYTNHAQFIFCFGVFDDFLFFSGSRNDFF